MICILIPFCSLHLILYPAPPLTPTRPISLSSKRRAPGAKYTHAPEHLSGTAFVFGAVRQPVLDFDLLQPPQASLELPLRIVFPHIQLQNWKSKRNFARKHLSLGRNPAVASRDHLSDPDSISDSRDPIVREILLASVPSVTRRERTERSTGSSHRASVEVYKRSADLGSNVVNLLHDAEDKHLSRAAGAFVVSPRVASQEARCPFSSSLSSSPSSHRLSPAISRVLTNIQSSWLSRSTSTSQTNVNPAF